MDYEVEYRVAQIQLQAAQRELDWSRNKASKVWVIGFLFGVVVTVSLFTLYGWARLLG